MSASAAEQPQPAPPILITGAAGFIGFHLTMRFLSLGHSVVGYDNLNDYYDPQLKRDRLAEIDKFIKSSSSSSASFEFIEGDVANLEVLIALFQQYKFRIVVHLAAQAGVRYSITNPHSYIQSNLVGFTNVLECCRHGKIEHLLYASSSSVYGGNMKTPFSESDNVDHPVSLYAATKKSNELMAHTYSNLYNLPTTGLRFFTVYGPWGRPDMATAIFTKNILDGKEIELFNDGNMRRDFTFVDDIVEGIERLILVAGPPKCTPKRNSGEENVEIEEKKEEEGGFDLMNPDPATSWAPYKVYNIGNNNPQHLKVFVSTLEGVLGVEAKKVMKPMQQGDVLVTAADTNRLFDAVGFAPKTELKDGLTKYAEWYRSYYKK